VAKTSKGDGSKGNTGKQTITHPSSSSSALSCPSSLIRSRPSSLLLDLSLSWSLSVLLRLASSGERRGGCCGSVGARTRMRNERG
jgi:hypothetical protein